MQFRRRKIVNFVEWNNIYVYEGINYYTECWPLKGDCH